MNHQVPNPDALNPTGPTTRFQTTDAHPGNHPRSGGVLQAPALGQGSPAPAAAAQRHGATGPTIAIVNESTVLGDAEVQYAVGAMQIQLDRDFQAFWHNSANLVFYGKGQTPEPWMWVMAVLDNSDQAGALGYHETTAQGLPVGKVFAADDKKYGLSWTVTLSHELIEMMGDPWIDSVVFAQTSNTAGTLYALELCDAVEDDSFAYEIDGVKVSDFVLPTWFEAGLAPGSVQFSFGHNVHAPFQLAKGGYIGLFQVPNTGGGWQQATAQEGPGARLLARQPGCRAERRKAPALLHPDNKPAYGFYGEKPSPAAPAAPAPKADKSEEGAAGA